MTLLVRGLDLLDNVGLYLRDGFDSIMTAILPVKIVEK